MSPSDFAAYVQTPNHTAAHRPIPLPPATPPTAHLNKFLTNMLQLAWYDEDHPPLAAEPKHHNDLYFLYTISGHVLIGPWPLSPSGFPQEMNEHYCGWAYLTPDQLPLRPESLQ